MTLTIKEKNKKEMKKNANKMIEKNPFRQGTYNISILCLICFIHAYITKSIIHIKYYSKNSSFLFLNFCSFINLLLLFLILVNNNNFQCRKILTKTRKVEEFHESEYLNDNTVSGGNCIKNNGRRY